MGKMFHCRISGCGTHADMPAQCREPTPVTSAKQKWCRGFHIFCAIFSGQHFSLHAPKFPGSFSVYRYIAFSPEKKRRGPSFGLSRRSVSMLRHAFQATPRRMTRVLQSVPNQSSFQPGRLKQSLCARNSPSSRRGSVPVF